MAADCSHHHAQPRSRAAERRLAATLCFVGVYFLAELFGGWWTGSLALLADAGHMFADMAALAISLFAVWMTRRPARGQRTFGHHRAEILAALLNGAALFLVAGGIVHEAWDRLHAPQAILAGPMLWIGVGGLVVNLISLSLLHGGRHESLNLRGAWLHVLGDTFGSVAVILSAIVIQSLGWLWIDPVVSAVICLLIAVSAGRLVRDAVHVLMESAPHDVNVEEVQRLLRETPGVEEVHCLHVWTIASGQHAVMAHVITPGGASDAQLTLLQNALRERFDLTHVALQLEQSADLPCHRCDAPTAAGTSVNDATSPLCSPGGHHHGHRHS